MTFASILPSSCRRAGVLLLVVVPSLFAQDDQAATATSAETPVIDFRDPIAVMNLGGPLMWPILLCSVVAVTIALERLVALRRGRILPRKFLRSFFVDLDAGKLTRDQALLRCRQNGSPAALVLQNAVRRWGRPMTEIEQAINDGGVREVVALRRNLRGLQSTANLATLLGLLGTVLGMILAFNQMAIASGQPRADMLASGISQALLTTAFGLAVAIPALFLHGFFSARVEKLVYELDRAALAVAERISAESGASESVPPRDEPVPSARDILKKPNPVERPFTKRRPE